jgi:Endosomal/lysosomal potassium channel TMEM175
MSKDRLEAFSDGVIAILITIMVLELRTPHAAYTAVALMWLIPDRRVERAGTVELTDPTRAYRSACCGSLLGGSLRSCQGHLL